ncbi:SDR family NAD(P)-dependent oxidoreductase [Paraburkholderia strydomiana]|uniref:SDR family NAD(P)-dependent oxidoreductase n=1 Tax=Paraburkholderia strydomiana TaxID=1245417 RepID=UPI0038BC62BB
MADSGWLGLERRVCVVTGAAGGIGAEIARKLVAAGAVVALLDCDEIGARAVAADLANSKGRVIAVRCDVTDLDSVKAAAETVVKTLGGCEVLVNNAAAIYADGLMRVQLEKWHRLMSVNVTGYLSCSQAFGEQMIQQCGGSMIHVASISGSFPQAYSGAYSVSKAAVKMMSRLLAVELGEHGIRSNVVSPAMVRTPMSERFYQDAEVLRRREEIVPVRRIGTPQDVAEAVLFLASDRSAYISGQDLLVDGGLSQSWLSLIPRPGFERQDTGQCPLPDFP